MAEEEQFLTIEEIASRLRVSDRSVRRWIESGRLRAYKPGGEWRIRGSDLAEFLDARSSPKAPAPPSQADDLTFDHLLEEERRRTEYDLILLAADSSRALKEILESLQASSPGEGIKAARRALARAFISMQAGFREQRLYQRLQPYEAAMIVLEVTDDRENWVLEYGMPLEEADALVLQTPTDVRRAIYEIHAIRRELTSDLREELGEWYAEQQVIKESAARIDQILDQVPDLEMLERKLEARARNN